MEGAKFDAVAHQEKEKPSPLVQGILNNYKNESNMGATKKTNHTVCESG